VTIGGEENVAKIEIRASGILVEDGKVLLAAHHKAGTDYWVLPGGHVRFGESAPEAVIRELREEANIEVEVGSLVLAFDYIEAGKRHVLNL